MPHTPTYTPEQWAKKRAKDAALEESTNAALRVGLDAAARGENIEAAMRAHHEATRVRPPSLDDHATTNGRLSAPGWTPERQREFLGHLAATGCVSEACAHVGLSKQSAYALRRRAPWSLFAIGWDAAIQMARQALLDAATERALAGREVDVWHRGERVGTRRVHNDRLLMFLLSRPPEPAHPVLTQRELLQLWPAILHGVDVILPPPLRAERLAELDAMAAADDDD